MTQLETRTERAASRREFKWLSPIAVVLAAGAVYMGLAFAAHQSKAIVLLPIMLVLGVLTLVLSLKHFELFVAICLAARASLDSVKIGHGSGNGLDPAA